MLTAPSEKGAFDWLLLSQSIPGLGLSGYSMCTSLCWTHLFSISNLQEICYLLWHHRPCQPVLIVSQGVGHVNNNPLTYPSGVAELLKLSYRILYGWILLWFYFLRFQIDEFLVHMKQKSSSNAFYWDEYNMTAFVLRKWNYERWWNGPLNLTVML